MCVRNLPLTGRQALYGESLPKHQNSYSKEASVSPKKNWVCTFLKQKNNPQLCSQWWKVSISLDWQWSVGWQIWCKNIKQTSTSGFASDFYIAPPVWDALAHKLARTQTDTRTPGPLRRVIITQLWLHKIGCKDKQASQLAPLTFPPLSSPLDSVSSLSPFLFQFFSYVTVYFFPTPLTNIFLYFFFLLFCFFFMEPLSFCPLS